MNELQEKIYSNDYADLLIPYTYTTPEQFLQAFAQYSPQLINSIYAMLHIRISGSANENPVAFNYSTVPNLFTTLDTSALEESGILKAQNQPALNLKGEGIQIGFIDTGIDYTHPAFMLPGKRTRIACIWDQTITSTANTGTTSYGGQCTSPPLHPA